MTKFAKKKYKHGVDKNSVVHEVFILKKNGKSLFDIFIENIPSCLESEKIILLTNILKIVKGEENNLPPTKYKQLKRDKKDKLVDYELKTKHFRLYFFKDDNNRMLVLGGTKKDETKNISKFRTIKKEYFKSCTQKKN